MLEVCFKPNIFFYLGFLSLSLTIRRIAGEYRRPSYSSLLPPPIHEHLDTYLFGVLQQRLLNSFMTEVPVI